MLRGKEREREKRNSKVELETSTVDIVCGGKTIALATKTVVRLRCSVARHTFGANVLITSHWRNGPSHAQCLKRAPHDVFARQPWRQQSCDRVGRTCQRKRRLERAEDGTREMVWRWDDALA